MPAVERLTASVRGVRRALWEEVNMLTHARRSRGEAVNLRDTLELVVDTGLATWFVHYGLTRMRSESAVSAASDAHVHEEA